uniref:TolC family protein n=1 Tax=Alloprevotella sp. TaxID=1872471 RepID=UPI004026E1D0
KIELQVNHEAFRVNVANLKLTLSLKNLDKAEENLRTAQVGFKEGVTTTSDLLAAQTAWLQAHSDKIDAQIDIKLSRAAYNKALGR